MRAPASRPARSRATGLRSPSTAGCTPPRPDPSTARRFRSVDRARQRRKPACHARRRRDGEARQRRTPRPGRRPRANGRTCAGRGWMSSKALAGAAPARTGDGPRRGRPRRLPATPRLPPAADRVMATHATALTLEPDGATLATLAPGTSGQIIGRSAGWVQIQLQGWVRETDLSGAAQRGDPRRHRGPGARQSGQVCRAAAGVEGAVHQHPDRRRAASRNPWRRPVPADPRPAAGARASSTWW